MTTEMKRVLTIAGSDPSGGAGIQLDLQVFALHGVHGMAVPTALTVQNNTGVKRVLPAFPNTVSEQLIPLFGDLKPHIIKLGMLTTDDIVLRVANLLERFDDIPRIVDPVLRASDGSYLLERRAWNNLTTRLINGATLVTPNLDECEALVDTRDPESAAKLFLEAGAHAVLVKGGHSDGPPDDLLMTQADREPIWFKGNRSVQEPVHGTGCALSSAIAARLALGHSLVDAVAAAKTFIEQAIENSCSVGEGSRILRLTSKSGLRP